MREHLYIDGQWQTAESGERFAVYNPASGAVLHHVAAGDARDIDKAVCAARRAFDNGPWRTFSGPERAGYLRAMADALQAREAELVRLEVLDNGKPLAEAQWDVADAIFCFRYYANLAETLTADAEPLELPDPRFTCHTVREPIGVAGLVTPWNYPLLMAAWKVAPALAAGCTAVLKPSEITPLSALELAAAAETAGLPNGVLNVVTGLGPSCGAPLSEHPGVDKLASPAACPPAGASCRPPLRRLKTSAWNWAASRPLSSSTTATWMPQWNGC